MLCPAHGQWWRWRVHVRVVVECKARFRATRRASDLKLPDWLLVLTSTRTAIALLSSYTRLYPLGNVALYILQGSNWQTTSAKRLMDGCIPGVSLPVNDDSV